MHACILSSSSSSSSSSFIVFADFLPDSEVAGYFTAIIPWIKFFDHQSSDSSNNITVVLENTCDEVFTIKISGGSDDNAFILGEEDLHDPQYDNIKVVKPFAQEYNRDNNIGDYEGEVCVYTMSLYATESFEDAYHTNRPAIISMLIVLIFLITSLAFMLFDCLVTRRQARLLNTALRQNAIVSSLFPKSVHKKLMEEAEVKTSSDKKNNKNLANRLSLGAVLSNDGNIMDGAINLDSKPIADLFPKTTIMFADISGFTGTFIYIYIYCVVLCCVLYTFLLLLSKLTIFLHHSSTLVFFSFVFDSPNTTYCYELFFFF